MECMLWQSPFFLSSRKEFSVASSTPNPEKKLSGSGSLFLKLVLGSVGVGAIVLAADQAGYIRKSPFKEDVSSLSEPDTNRNWEDARPPEDKVILPVNEEPSSLAPVAEVAEINDVVQHNSRESPSESELEVSPAEEIVGSVEEEETKTVPDSNLMPTDEQTTDSSISSGEGVDKEISGNGLPVTASLEENKGNVNIVPEEVLAETETLPTTEDNLKEALGDDTVISSSLLKAYSLEEKDESSQKIAEAIAPFPEEIEASLITNEDSKDADILQKGKLVLDIIEVIHTAEKRQAELDAHTLAEEKKILKEKYEKALKDARARELMYAEEAAMLDKEINREKTKAAATIKLLQQKAEENLKSELQRKEEEAELKLKKVQDLAKAELAAAIAAEKSSQIEKMSEANLHGALALEDALSKGMPIRSEIDTLYCAFKGIDRDSLLDLFDALKGKLRHYSLIPAGGGGILTHAVAHIASSIKMKEDDQSEDGIESIINRVERFLGEGKLAEAADALEAGIHGSQAEEVASEWVRRARDRAVTDQALSLLQAYATAISLT
ncbi:hypothetical protein QJS04_geneDACA000718 [Acorus gramineus]|uniref:MICOS complex subunit MIC60 n=1 Tax=Acorus gramineus TaxID=55184 RepID=A0AAV9ASF0_ACOGR|nr:hypothetical protein QJS04_geneDACA000718 [Acorus gramineus]